MLQEYFQAKIRNIPPRPEKQYFYKKEKVTVFKAAQSLGKKGSGRKLCYSPSAYSQTVTYEEDNQYATCLRPHSGEIKIKNP